MNVSRTISYIFISSLLRLFAVLPLGFHRAFARLFSFLASSVFRYRRDDVMMNLSRAFPEMGIHQLKETRKLFYRHIGNIITEAVWFGGCRNPRRLIRSGIVKMSNPEVIGQLYDKGRSVIVLASHNGNWELYGGYRSYGEIGFPENNLSVVYRQQDSAVADRILFQNRQAPIVDKKHFDGLQESAQIMRYVYMHRLEQKLYLFINDQRPYFDSSANLEVEFLHRKVLTMTGAVALAKMFGFAVVYQNMDSDGQGHYTISFRTICEDASDADIREVIETYYRYLEADMRAKPWNYLWTHRRWEYYRPEWSQEGAEGSQEGAEGSQEGAEGSQKRAEEFQKQEEQSQKTINNQSI